MAIGAYRGFMTRPDDLATRKRDPGRKALPFPPTPSLSTNGRKRRPIGVRVALQAKV